MGAVFDDEDDGSGSGGLALLDIDGEVIKFPQRANFDDRPNLDKNFFDMNYNTRFNRNPDLNISKEAAKMSLNFQLYSSINQTSKVELSQILSGQGGISDSTDQL